MLSANLGHYFFVVGGFSSTTCYTLSQLMMQSWENDKNPKTPKTIFCEFHLYLLDIVPSYHLYNLKENKGKLINQTWENGKISGPILPSLTQICPYNFLRVLPLLIIRNYSKLSSYTISRKTNEPNFRKMAESLILGPILACLPTKFGSPSNFFFTGSTSAVARHCSKLSSYAI